LTFSRILHTIAVIVGVALAIGLPLREWRKARSKLPPIHKWSETEREERR